MAVKRCLNVLTGGSEYHTSGSAKRVGNPNRETVEIAVACDQLADAVLDTQCRDVGVMDQIASNSGLSNDCGHDIAVPFRL